MTPQAEPRLAWRSISVLLIVTLGWCVLMGRMIQIQWLQREQFAGRATRQQRHEDATPARPGDLYDRRGRLLATTIAVQSLYVDPTRIADSFSTACTLAEATGLDPTEIQQRILDQRDKRFLWIKRRLSDAEVERVVAANLPPTAWGFRPEYLRVYPQGALAAQRDEGHAHTFCQQYVSRFAR